MRVASEIEVRPQETELDALLLENELIQKHRPRYNVDGAFSFLYPAIGVGRDEGRALFCFTTRPEDWKNVDLRWYGSYRSRLRAKDAFDALVYLLALVGHQEPRSRLPASQRIRGSRLVAFRRISRDLAAEVEALFAGDDREVLGTLAEILVEKPQARFEAPEVEERLRVLDDFARHDVARLREALERAGRTGHFVPREERDALFLATRDRGQPAPDDLSRVPRKT